jgi:flagellar protein FlaI
MDAEIQIRKKLLDEMRKQEIRDYISVATLFHAYSIDPRNVIAHIADLRQVIQ